MKPVLLAAGLALAATPAALAGSRTPVPAEPPVMTPVAPAPIAYDWTGGYVGLGLGYGEARHRQDSLPQFWPNGSGFSLGALAGYNWQSGNTVWGVEGHLSGNRLRGTTTTGVPTEIRTDITGLASLRGRLGWAQDRTLVFVTAGPALGRVSHTAVNLGQESRSVSGAMVGVGIEQAVSAGMTIRGDLEHYRFGSRDFTTAGLNFPGARSQATVARISAVFRF